jgi:hypothetical protein
MMKRRIITWTCIVFGILSLSYALAVQIPADVHERILKYPGANLVGYEQATLGDGRQVYEVDLDAGGAKYEDVVAFYQQETRKRGWKIFDDVNRGYSFILLCHDGRYKIDITVMSRDNRILIHLTITG